MIGTEEREQVAVAFHQAFSENRGSVTNERGDADILSGATTVEAENSVMAWNTVLHDLLELLSESSAVRDPEKALKALDFLYVEVAAEEVCEDLVARALSGEVSWGTLVSDTEETEATHRRDPNP